MFNRFCFGALLLACIMVPLTGCNLKSSGLDSISISPNTDLQLVVGNPATLQLTATGTFGNAAHPTHGPVSGVTWSSAIPGVAAVGSTTGVVSAVGAGSTTITATAQGFGGPVSASVEVTVVGSGSTGPGSTAIVSLAIIPASQTVAVPGDTGQFTAIGTTASGGTTDLTFQVAWGSSSHSIATVGTSVSSPGNPAGGTAGLALAVSQGTTSITAIYTNTIADGGNVIVSTTPGSFTVSGGSAGPASTTVVSLAIVPASQTVASPPETGQFIAIGTTVSGGTTDLTAQVAWGSSSASIATVGTSISSPGNPVGGTPGLATAVSQGTASITAVYTNTVADGGNVIASTTPGTFTVSSGASATQEVTSLAIIPNTSQTISASGQKTQYIAIATFGTGGTTKDVTNDPNLTWTSSIPTYATICTVALGTVPANCATTPGLVTGAASGTTTIEALYTNSPSKNVVTATAPLQVSSTLPPEPLLSLEIIPSSITVANLQGTGNFMAIGTFSTAPYVRDLTNSVTWSTSFPNDFTVSSDSTSVNPGAPGGIVTPYASGVGVTVIAEATAPDGSIQTATSQFSCPLVLPCPCTPTYGGCSPALAVGPSAPGYCGSPVAGSCFPGSEGSSLLSTVTVYNEGLNTSNWLVTASSATGTVDVIHCGPGWALGGNIGGSVCVGTYPIGAPLVLTATQVVCSAADVTAGLCSAATSTTTFGGWSSNCTSVKSTTDMTPTAINATGPNYCELFPTDYDETVGAIFN